MSKLLGGECSSEEVAAAAGVAWRALAAHPPDTSRGRSQLAALQPARVQLEGQLGGRVEDAPLLTLAQQHAALQRWQQQLNPGTSQQQQQPGGKAAPPGFGKAPAGAPAVPAVPAMSAEEAVLAVCGISADVAAEVYAAAAAGSGDGGAARAALAAALAPKAAAPRMATAAEAAAVEEEVFGAKGRVLNAQAGARWLIQWCGRVTGGAASRDDTVPTAVARLLLSGGAGGWGCMGGQGWAAQPPNLLWCAAVHVNTLRFVPLVCSPTRSPQRRRDCRGAVRPAGRGCVRAHWCAAGAWSAARIAFI